jgi:glucose-6-phosphate dehydrogenase assembly protein OpcA
VAPSVNEEVSARTEVAPDKIESALSARWRRIAEASKEQSKPPLTRAFLWNLIVSGRPDLTPALVDELAAELPARAIVLRNVVEPCEGERLHVFVETNLARQGTHQVGSDEIIIEVRGTDDAALTSLRRVPSIVRSALVPDALTALLWCDVPPPVEHVACSFIGEVDRLILDSRRLPREPDGERGLARIMAIARKHPDLELCDISWLGISPLRGLLASLFDPPRDSAPLGKLDEVVVVSGVEGVQVRGLLMLGWLGCRLGWREPAQMRAEHPGQRRFTATRKDGGQVLLRIETERDGVKHGVRRLELRSGQERWSLSRDHEKITVEGPGIPRRQQPARSHSLAERLAEGLGGKGRDPIYREALAFAAALAGAVDEGEA